MKTLKLITVLIVLYTSFLANSQTDLLWAFHTPDSLGVGFTTWVTDLDADQTTGAVYVVGYFQSAADFDFTATVDAEFSMGNDDIFIAKYNDAGILMWKFALGSTTAERVTNVVVDNNGDVLVTGIITGTVDLDPGAGVANHTPNGSYDVFVAKYSSLGTYIWSRSFGGSLLDFPSDITVDSGNNVYTTGYYQGTADLDPNAGVASYTSPGGRDGFVQKLSSTGAYLWSNVFSSTGNATAAEVAIDNSGDVVITGNFINTVDFDPSSGVNAKTSAGNDDFFVAKYTDAGALVWVNSFGDINGDFPRGLAIDGSNNIIMGATVNNSVDVDPGVGSTVITGPARILLKYSSTGAFTWVNDLGNVNLFMEEILSDSFDNIYIEGRYMGTVDFDATAGVNNQTAVGSFDVFTAKYVSNGGLNWVNSVGGTGNDMGYGLAKFDSYLYLGGTFNALADFDPSAGVDNIEANYQNGFVSSYSTFGNYRWSGNIGGFGAVSNPQEGKAMTHDASNNVFVAGTTSGTVDMDPSVSVQNLTRTSSLATQVIAKYDQNRVFLWATVLEGTGSASPEDIELDPSGNIVTIGGFQNTVDFDPNGGVTNLTSNGGLDVYLSKYNSTGDLIWAISFGGTGYDRGNDLAIDGAGNIYITGSYVNTVDFDPGSGVVSRTSAGSNDVFLAKFDANGIFQWVINAGGTSNDIGHNVEIDESGNVILLAGFINTVDFDPGGTTTVTSAGGQDFAIAKYSNAGTLIWLTKVGGTGQETTSDLELFNDEIFITGTYSGTTDLDPSPSVVNYTSNGSYDFFILKLNSIGEYIWSRAWGTTNNDLRNELDLDSYGHPYIVGTYNGSIDIDGSTSSDNFTSNDGYDIFVYQLDGLDGDYLSGITVEGVSSDYSGDIDIDEAGAVLITGMFYANADFDPTASEYELVSYNNADLFVAKYDWAVPLPITLGGLSAFEDGDKNRIEWSTITERNVSHFEVEASIDGVTFDVIASTNAIGNSTTINNYSAIDYAPGEFTYYRIKSVDNNGTFEYTNTVSVKRSGKSFVVYPNPGNEIVNISSAKRIELVEIYTTDGKVVLESEHQKIDTSELVAGAYIIKVSFLNQEVETTLWMKR